MSLLDSKKIEIGNAFIKQVDEKIFKANVIFWLFKNCQWQLIFGTALVDLVGTQQLYNKIYDIYASNEAYHNWFYSFDIYLTSLDDPLTKSINSLFKLNNFGRVIVQDTVINGIVVEDAIIIRST